jgi:uncharacterized membrane protein
MSVAVEHEKLVRDQRASLAFAIIAALVVIALLIVPKILQNEAGHTGDLDTGNYSNLAWAIFHGEGFRGSVLGRHHLGEHFSPIMLLIAPIYLVVQSADVLMTIQALAVASGIIACAWLLRPNRFAIVTLIVLCLFHPAVLATWRTQFQPIELGFPLVVLALIAIERRSNTWLIVWAVLLLMTRESAPLSVLGLSIYAAITRRFKLAAILAVAAGIWFAITMFVLMPYFRGSEHWVHAKYFGPWAQWDKKALYLFVLLAGFGVLPLLGRKALAATMGAIPGVILNLVVDRETQYTFVGHYDAQVVAFLMFATVQGLLWWTSRSSTENAASKLAGYTQRWGIAAAIGVSVIMSFAMNARGPIRLLREWWPDHQDRLFVREAREAGRRYVSAPALAAHGRIGPQVCHRPSYMTIRPQSSTEDWIDWASSRLVPGEILLLPKRGLFKSDDELNQVERSGRAQHLETTETLEIYQWPTDAPPPGTPAAHEYAASGVIDVKPAKKKPKKTARTSSTSRGTSP